MTLSIAWQHPTDRAVVLALHGRLDWVSAADLRAAISEATASDPLPSAIVVDLSAVEFIDEIGVGTLVVADRICRQIGVDLAVGSPSPLVRRLLGMGLARQPNRRNPSVQPVAEKRVRVRSPDTG